MREMKLRLTLVTQTRITLFCLAQFLTRQNRLLQQDCVATYSAGVGINGLNSRTFFTSWCSELHRNFDVHNSFHSRDIRESSVGDTLDLGGTISADIEIGIHGKNYYDQNCDKTCDLVGSQSCNVLIFDSSSRSAN